MVNRRTHFLALSIICWMAILFSISIIRVASPPNSYESSIYLGYPVLLWILLAIPFVAFAALLAWPIDDKGGPRAFLPIAGAAFTSAEILLTLPYLRYFFFSGGDTLTNLGNAKDIMATGHFGISNIYPALYVWLAQLSYSTGLSLMILIMFALQIFFIIYIVSMLLLTREMGLPRPACLFVVLLSMIPLFSMNTLQVLTSHCAFFLIPFALYLVFRSRHEASIVNSIALVFVLLILPFMHPEAAFFLLVILICISISFFLANVRRVGRPEVNNAKLSVTNPIMILVVALVAWMLYSITFAANVETVYSAIFLNQGDSFLDRYGSLISMSKIQLPSLVWLIFVVYGAVFMVIFLALLQLLISNPIRWIKLRDQKAIMFLVTYFVLAVFAVFFILEALLIDTRAFRYLIWLSTIICGLLFYDLTQTRPTNRHGGRIRFKFIRKALTVGLITTILAVTIIGFYPSPGNRTPNDQINQSDYYSMEFFFAVSSSLNSTFNLFGQQLRYGNAILGVESNPLGYGTPAGKPLPPHFNYHNRSSESLLGTKRTSYLILNELSHEFYPTIYPEFEELWKLNEHDFEHLESDQRVSKFFDNGNYRFYEVMG